MAENSQNADSNKFKMVRCMDWLQKQNHPKKLAQQNKNDIKFIIETNAHRKKFLLSTAEDDATVPGGVDDLNIQPKKVPLLRLRVDNLLMECEWQSCKLYFVDYDLFQKHVAEHASDVHVIETQIKEGDVKVEAKKVSYVCLWDVCGHETSDFDEMVRHVNYHAYHGHLLAIGFNGRATLKLESCRKDSSNRNHLPPLKAEHTCRWFECTLTFNSYQKLLDHVKQHIFYSDNNLCSWAGCGMKFNRRVLLTMHMRSHTGERLIACYHCGRHFCSNHKLSTHLARQNVVPESGYQCSVCGKWYATEYLVREHSRQHVSYYACSLCDMSAPTRAAIAIHARYRHLAPDTRTHACPLCPYKGVKKADLQNHMKTHSKQRRKRKVSEQDSDGSSSSSEEPLKKEVKKEKRQYACHMCPPKEVPMFSRGHNLTTHLVKVHGAQWPFGHSRFRYQISEDGIYRLTTTRIEDLEVSKKIVGGYSGPKESLDNKFEYDLKQIADETIDTPKQFEITFKDNAENKKINIKQESGVEIYMIDVDETGNIISTEKIVQMKTEPNNS